MALTKTLLNFSLNYLKFFFILWKRKFWSGGWSFGKKIFWGAVGKVPGIRYTYKILSNYSIWNTTGYIASALSSSYTNSQFIFVYYPEFLFLNFQLWEETQQLLDKIRYSSSLEELIPGNSTLLVKMQPGFLFFNVQVKKFSQAIFAWSAGCFCKILKIEHNHVFIQLPSKLIYTVSFTVSGTLGISAKSILHYDSDIFVFKNIKKLNPWLECFKSAGRARLLTARTSKVRGYAMNPVDHPHGGWTKGGIHFWTPAGFLTWNVKTRSMKIWSRSKIFWLKNNSLKQL